MTPAACGGFDREETARRLLPKSIRVARAYARRVGREVYMDDFESAAGIAVANAVAAHREGNGTIWRLTHQLVVRACYRLCERHLRPARIANEDRCDGWESLGCRDERAEEFERDSDVSVMLAGLSEPDERLIRLLYWEGLNAIEAGMRLGLSSHTVRKYRNRVLDRMRVQLS